jgi:hypothetical protein
LEEPGGRRKNYTDGIANKSGVENSLYKAVIFLGEFLHCGYKFVFEEIGKIRFNSVNSRKNSRKKL